MHGFPCRGSMSKGLQSRIDADHHATHGGGASRAWAFGLSNFCIQSSPRKPPRIKPGASENSRCVFCCVSFVCLLSSRAARGAPRRHRLPGPRRRLAQDTPSAEAEPRLAQQLRRPGASEPSSQAALLKQEGEESRPFFARLAL